MLTFREFDKTVYHPIARSQYNWMKITPSGSSGIAVCIKGSLVCNRKTLKLVSISQHREQKIIFTFKENKTKTAASNPRWKKSVGKRYGLYSESW